jgi:hypothetical protein
MAPCKKQARAHGVRGSGSSIQQQTVGDNVEKLPGQQGLVTTCKDSPNEAKEERAQREWRMSLYERRRRSNVLPGDGLTALRLWVNQACQGCKTYELVSLVSAQSSKLHDIRGLI